MIRLAFVYKIRLIVVRATIQLFFPSRFPSPLFTTDQIHGLCLLLSYEKDEAKALELAKALHEMLTSNLEFARSRMEFLAKHYPELDLGAEPLDPAA